MGYELDAVNFKAGDPIRAADLMALVDAVRRPMGVARGGAGIDVRQGARGQVHVTGSSQRGAYPGLVSGIISARSGAMAGTGSVDLLMADEAGNMTSVGLTVSVYNFSGAAPVPAGKYCWVEQDDGDNWWLVSAEC